MADITKRLEELEKYQNRIVASIKELNTTNIEMKQRLSHLEKENEELRQLVNANGTNIIIEQAKRETELKKITEIVERLETNKPSAVCVMERPEKIDIPMPTFYGNARDPHPKKFLAEIEKYFTFRKIGGEDQMLVIENALKAKASAWYGMMKYASPNFEKFKDLFLKQYFSESHQWETFIQCTEAGKKTVRTGFQEHFHFWMTQLKYLDMPKMEEGQAINLIVKHFPISIQAYVQNCSEKKFIPIWEKLGEIENRGKNENKPETELRRNEYRQDNRKTESEEKPKQNKFIPRQNIKISQLKTEEYSEEDEEDDSVEEQSKNEDGGIVDAESLQY